MARPIAAVRVSRVNQATRRSFSIAAWARASTKCDLPVPDGPAMTRFSARPIHSRVASAFWVAAGMEESSGRQEAKVLPAGKPGGLAAHPAGGGVAAGDFLGEQDAEDLGGVPALGAGGGQHVGGGLAQVGQPHPAQQRVQLGGERRGGGAGHRVSGRIEQFAGEHRLAAVRASPPGPSRRVNRLQSSHRRVVCRSPQPGHS